MGYPRRQHRTQPLGRELAVVGDHPTVPLVALAHHERPAGLAVEQVAHRRLDEGPLVLDDEDLLDAPAGGPHDRGLHR